MFKIFNRYMRKHVEREVIHKKETVENPTNKQKSYCYCFCDKSFFPNYFKRFNKRFGNCRRTLVGVKENDKEKGADDTFKTSDYLRNPWIEAIGWSGTLAFGWAISQNFHLYVRRRNLQEYVACHQFENIGLQKHLCPRHIFKNILVNNVLAQPNDFVHVKSLLSSDNVSVSQTSLPVFGPKTAEQALNEATDGVKKVRNETIGELENRLGLRCMSKQQYRKAIIHFAAGSALQSNSATFNLAQCYELGLGTTQDYKKAAKCYRTASDQGNASATYNLAVFYAHGLGGLKLDRNKALQLLQIASALGEPNAKQLLERYIPNKTPIPAEKQSQSETTIRENSQEEKTEEIKLTQVKPNFSVLRFHLSLTKLAAVTDKLTHRRESNSVSTDDGLNSEYESSHSSISSCSGSSYGNESSGNSCYSDPVQRSTSGESSISLPHNSTEKFNRQRSTESGFEYPVPLLMKIHQLVTASTPGL